MTAVYAEFAWLGASGVHSMKTGPTYEAVWRVFSNDPLAQAQRVIQWFRANVVELADHYEYANDNVGSIAIAKRIAAHRELGTTDVWLVTVTYEPYDDKQDDPGRDADGNPTDNPIDWRPKVTVRTNRFSEPCESATYLTGFKGTTAGKILSGTQHIPMNSAMVPFNPGLERDKSNVHVVIERNLPTFDCTQATSVLNNRPVCAAAFQLDWAGVTLRVLPFEAKLCDFDASPNRLNGFDFVRVVWGFEVKEPDWIDEVVDRGVLARALLGDADGRGSQLVATDLIHGVPKLRRLVDHDETPVSDPVLLDGDGGPLDLSVTPVQENYISWLKYGTVNYLTLPFFQGVLLPL